jgi:hypothetical protein
MADLHVARGTDIGNAPVAIRTITPNIRAPPQPPWTWGSADARSPASELE